MSTRRLQYNYAQIRVETGLCVGVLTCSYEIDNPGYIPIPSLNNAFKGKYYHDGAWYEDAEFTIPWSLED